MSCSGVDPVPGGHTSMPEDARDARRDLLPPLALVTGGARRVGRALVLELAGLGFDVLIHAHRSSDAGQALAAELRDRGSWAEVVRADLLIPSEVDALAAQVLELRRPLSLLVHNAGCFLRGSLLELAPTEHRAMMTLHVDAPLLLTRVLAPALHAAEGQVIFLGDVLGDRPVPGCSSYAVSKAAAMMMARALALELAPAVRVNVIAPGIVAAPEGFPPEARARLAARIPLAREGTPEDVGRALRYLLEATYVTGEVLVVDGGRRVAL